jgi:exodeoxyribonuclease VII small subunit
MNDSREMGGASAAASDAELRFEVALERLEAAVDALAGGELELEVALAKYEEGVRLFRVCSERLDAARLRIRALEETTHGTRERTLELEETP